MNKEYFEKGLFISTISITALFIFYCQYVFITHYTGQEKYIDFGTIQSKYSAPYTTKNSGGTNFYFNVNFDNEGFHTKNVDATSYFKYKEGERVCMSFYKEYSRFKSISGFIGVFAFVIEAIALIVMFLVYLIKIHERYYG